MNARRMLQIIPYGRMLCLIGLTIGLGATMSRAADAPDLRQQAAAALASGNLDSARDLLLRQIEINARDADAWYDLARVYSRGGDTALALKSLAAAQEAGFADAARLRADPDLESVRAQAGFAAVLERMEAPPADPASPDWIVHRVAPMRVLGNYSVFLPPDYATSGRDYPVCVLLHGNTGNEQSFASRMLEVFGREDVIFIALRAPYVDMSVALRGRPGFTAWPSVADASDLTIPDTARRDYVDWIFSAVADARANFRIQSGGIYLVGSSQGGGFAAAAAALYPEQVRSFFSQSGEAMPVSIITDEAIRKMSAAGVQSWLVHGRDDTTVEPWVSTRLAERLQAAGAPVELHLVAGPHRMTDEMAEIAKGWMNQVVRARE